MLKFAVDKIEDVEEPLRPLYDKSEDGKFRLKVDGAVDKSKIDEFRTTNITVMKERDEFKKALDKFGSVDVEKYQQMLEQEEKIKSKKLIDEGKIEELLAERTKAMKAKLEGDVGTLTTQVTQLRTRLEKTLIDSELSKNAVESGCLDTAIEDIIWRGRQVFSLRDDKVVPLKEGAVWYGSDGVTPMSMKEWLGQLAASAPHLFKQSKGGGSSNTGSAVGAGGASKKSDLKTAAEKAAYISKNGRDKYLSLPA